MRRWLVTLALAVVALPNTANPQGFRVELTNRSITTSQAVTPSEVGQPRVARLPVSVELDAGAITITTRKHTVRHTLGRRDGLSWIVTVGPHVLVGFAANPGGGADSIVAIDHMTGRIAWRRSMDSLFAAELVDQMIAVERAGNLDILDARTGNTLGTTPLRAQAIVAVCRPASGDLHLKTAGDLIAITRTGAVRWTQATSSISNPTVTSTSVIDAWVDRSRHRFGIASYDRSTGQQLDKIDLGATGGWYDYERVVIAPDGVNDVLVTAAFGVG